MAEKTDAPPKPPIPMWAWGFAIACGIIPALTLGGAIPGAIGFGGAAGCLAVARDASQPLGTRLAMCSAITVGSWALFVLLIGGLSTVFNQ